MKITFAFIALFFTAYACSQSWQLPYINYTIKDGLPSNEVYDVLQDSFGYMWFATDNGLSRFDGYKFKNYGKEKGLTDRVIFDLQLDKYGRIWMSSLSQKLFIYDSNLDSVLAINAVNEKIRNCSSSKLKYYFNNDSNILTVYCKTINILFQLDKYQLLSIKEIPFEKVHYENGNSYDIELKSSKPSKIKYSLNNRDTIEIPLFNRNIDFFPKAFKYKNEFIIISFFSGCYVIYNNKYVEINHLNIEDILFMDNGSFYASYTSNRGVKFYEDINDFIDNGGKYLLTNISSSGLYLDKSGNFWICSIKTGTYKLNINRKILITDNLSIHPSTPIKKIINEENDQIAVFLKNGVYFKVSKKLNHDNNYKKTDPKFGESFNEFYKINNEYYFLTENYQLVKYKNNKTFIFDFKCKNANDFHGSKVFNLEKNSEIILPNFEGIHLFDLSSNNCNSYKHSRIIDLIENSKKEIILVGVKGLFQFKDFKLIPIKRNLDIYLSSRIDYLRELADSTLVLASKNDGLYFLRDGCLDYYDLIKEFNVDLIKFIEVNNNNLWVVTSKSIIVLKYINNNIVDKAFFKLGLDLPQDQIHSLIFDKDKVYIGMEKNIVSMDNSEVFQKSTYAPKPFLEKLLIRNKNRKIENEITLKHYENNVSIKLLAINYTLQGEIEYKYGINDGEYQDIVNSRDINLIELAHGKYELRFIAKNESGIWSEPTFFTMVILPPWWQTWWFYILIGLVISFFTYLLMRRRLHTQKKDALLKEEIRNLEKSALQAQMNPHFIFNSLNSIQKYILINNKEEASEYLSKFASLIRLNLKSSNSNVVALNEEILLLSLYLDLEKLRFKNKFSYDFKIEVDENRIQKIRIPPMLLQPIIENAILHGIAGISEEGRINILIKDVVLENYLSIVITDNGKGIGNVKNSINHQSLGSKITKKRLELISNSENNNFNLMDLLDDEGNVIGAKAEIIVTYKMEESE